MSNYENKFDLFNQTTDPEMLLQQNEVQNEMLNRKFYTGPDLTRKQRELIQNLFESYLIENVGKIDQEVTVGGYNDKMNKLEVVSLEYVHLLNVKVPQYIKVRFNKARKRGN